MNEIKNKNEITSKKLLEQVNFFREKEYEFKTKNGTLTEAEKKRGKFVKLEHKDLLKVVRNEFSEEIEEGKISPSFYKAKTGNGTVREYDMFILTLNQAKQVLIRESKFVRKAVIEYIENLEEAIKKLAKPKSKADVYLELYKLELRNERLQKCEDFINTRIKMNKLYTTTEVAQMFNITPNQLHKVLEKYNIIKIVEFKLEEENNNRKYWELTENYNNQEYGELVHMRLKGLPYLKWKEKGITLIFDLLLKEKLLDYNFDFKKEEDEFLKIEIIKHEYSQDKIFNHYQKKEN